MINRSARRPFIYSLIFVLGLLTGIVVNKYGYKLFYYPKQSGAGTVVETNKEDPELIKKNELESFFKKQLQLISDESWDELYKTLNPSDISWYTTEDLRCSFYKKTKPHSVEYFVNSINLHDKEGVIDVTVITCIDEKCEDANREEKRITKYFENQNNRWFQRSIKEPTDEIRELAAFAWANIGSQKTEFTERYGCGTADRNIITRAMAITVANDPEKLAQWKVHRDSIKENQSNQSYTPSFQEPAIRPIIKVETPAVSNRINCTSSRIGNYTYTNCY